MNRGFAQSIGQYAERQEARQPFVAQTKGARCRACALAFPQCKLPDKLRSAETERLVRRRHGMNRRRRRIERKPMHRLPLKPRARPSQVRHRSPNKGGEISGGFADQGDALLNAQRARRSELLLAEPALESEGLRLPLRERPPGEESNPERIRRCREFSECMQHGARSLWLLLGIVEDEEQPL